MADEPSIDFLLPRFDIHRQGREWVGGEARERLRRLGECKLEVLDGRLFVDEFQRRMVLGMLLENLGLDAALELVQPELWHQALAAKVPSER